MLCSDCAGKSLGTYISRHGDKGVCRFCGKEKNKVLPCDEIENFISDAWQFYYENADEAEVPAFEVLPTYDIEDILEDKEELELEDTNELFLEQLRSDFSERQWFRIGENEVQGSNEMLYSWKQFCEIVKHKWRYTFPFVKDIYYYSVMFSSKNILKIVSELLDSQNCISKISPDVPIYRGRNFKNKKEVLLTAKDIGTPTAENAKQANRFSPEGIPMFYGCLNSSTVKYEIGDGEYLFIGEFHTSKDIVVLDLTALPNTPSLYDDEKNMFISGIDFLREFAYAVSENVSSNEKLDYVPTQIFTEYIRQVGLKKFNIRGIKYHSAKCIGEYNVVLFYENDDCFDDISQNKEGLILKNVIYEKK